MVARIELESQLQSINQSINQSIHQSSFSLIQAGGLRRDLTDLRMVADQEVVARIELESQLQSRDDEIDFLKRSYEEKIRILMDTDVGEYQVSPGLGQVMWDLVR